MKAKAQLPSGLIFTLESHPQNRYCEACAAILEHRNGSSMRPLATDVVAEIFADACEWDVRVCCDRCHRDFVEPTNLVGR